MTFTSAIRTAIAAAAIAGGAFTTATAVGSTTAEAHGRVLVRVGHAHRIGLIRVLRPITNCFWVKPIGRRAFYTCRY